MGKIKEEVLNNVYLKIEYTKQLALILEDYCYLITNDRNYAKYHILSSTVVEKIDEIKNEIDDLLETIK